MTGHFSNSMNGLTETSSVAARRPRDTVQMSFHISGPIETGNADCTEKQEWLALCSNISLYLPPLY